VVPGAEEFHLDGGPIGALLVHGFTGCPASMRPLGKFLAQNGLAVSCPRLPGHGTTWEDLAGTTWQDWEREAEAALDELAGRASSVVAVGLSMGGGLALHLAVKHPGKLRGVVGINPAIRDPRLAAAPVVRLFVRSLKGLGNDIKRPGQDELPYDRVPVRVLPSLRKLFRTVDRDLPELTLPLLVFSSTEDHVVDPSNPRRVIARAASVQKELVPLTNSYHVATLDYDAETVFQRTLEFARSVSTGE
jgi:carboxylesterase